MKMPKNMLVYRLLEAACVNISLYLTSTYRLPIVYLTST